MRQFTIPAALLAMFVAGPVAFFVGATMVVDATSSVDNAIGVALMLPAMASVAVLFAMGAIVSAYLLWCAWRESRSK